MKRCILMYVLMTCFIGIFGQNSSEEKIKQKFPLIIAFSTHSYSWPIVKSFVTPVQPGFVFGTEYSYSTKGKSELLQSFNAGYFKNPDFLKAYYINSYFTYRYAFMFKAFTDVSIGLGYIQRRNAREVFKLNDNGEYESKTDWGSPGIQAGIKFGIGYNFKFREKQLSTFINYESFVEYPHAKGFIPFVPHSLYNIGLRYNIFN